ncbi:pilus assembly FimT family protein [Shewanella fidelis]|uniref:Prepilin-type N-terminal cleavage/methylation domain-containing protein n=1 Tax=Shewanella fidelis TaxID=173509 RepID=A0AAW8NJD7_9GAMM|nr:prepilin-type N-terminal cleavage/methylation domain-containing protein [Shewanella fidelis]MDR8522636.1 prepilin-type N-terminal cleavage/methylation domain-containing protein [Shewanella fidelis]MDW4812252.1 prepilin-type N-terminal cleavage/methylation domain-containing protein [Shewanella fidelis]MDW4816084.1 prepilin-type N-terminal cleavage/methylation domain-containing protein [Shewanella fidelis]MDW4820493.1 prepilin-type N-terminal cleavage/methylation domain-containing protein [She
MQSPAIFSAKHTQPQAGFTLIELVVVIIVLGILAVIAAPKFLNLSEDAQVAQVKNTGGAFKSGINLARSVWAVKVGSGPAENLPVYGESDDAHVDFNANGWPAQHYFTDTEASPQLDNVEDCISVWQIIFQNDEPTVSDAAKADETDYKATYNSPAACTYQYSDNMNLSISYDSNNGSVVVDSDPSS